MINTIHKLIRQINRHNTYRNSCLNLIASENLMSPMTRWSLSSDLGNRYTIGPVDHRGFAGSHYFDKIERKAVSLAQKLFHARYANVQPVSGMVANMVAFRTLLKPGDLAMSLLVKHTGHYSHVRNNLLSLFNVRVEPLPFDVYEFNIDILKAEKIIKKNKPKMIILGTSEFLFPAPIRKLRKICDEAGTKILYDASHVSGLLAGQTFQNPLVEGADFLSLSTNKTLAAPNHGIVACDKPELYQKKIEKAIAPMFTSNVHAHHIAGLAITLTEFEQFGHEYATQVIKNAQVLAQALYEKEISVLCPHKNFTLSHTVLFDVKRPGNEVMRLLEKVNIIANPFQLPWNKASAPTGIRIGTNELTRLGMKEEEMKVVAGFFSNTLHNRKPINEIRNSVIEFRKPFQKIHYSFENKSLKY